MRVIFLDIDGVLNSHRTAAAYREPLMRKLDPVSVKLLHRIVSKADAKLVISSTWRLDPDWLTLVWGCLREAGWPCDYGDCPIIGRTAKYLGIRKVRGDLAGCFSRQAVPCHRARRWDVSSLVSHRV